MVKERGVISARHFYFTRCKTSCVWKYLERCRTMRIEYCHVHTCLMLCSVDTTDRTTLYC